jgi:hypothetical protein
MEQRMNINAQALGRLAKGHRKRYSAIEIERRRIRLAEARIKRWVKRTDEKTKE